MNSFEFKKEFKKEFNLDVTNIYNPLNLKQIKFLSKKKIKLNFFKKKNCLKIINIGRFTDQKDHLTLLKSVREIKSKINFKLLIIGRGKNYNLMKKFIEKNHLNDNVKIIGFKKSISFFKISRFIYTYF